MSMCQQSCLPTLANPQRSGTDPLRFKMMMNRWKSVKTADTLSRRTISPRDTGRRTRSTRRSNNDEPAMRSPTPIPPASDMQESEQSDEEVLSRTKRRTKRTSSRRREGDTASVIGSEPTQPQTKKPSTKARSVTDVPIRSDSRPSPMKRYTHAKRVSMPMSELQELMKNAKVSKAQGGVNLLPSKPKERRDKTPPGFSKLGFEEAKRLLGKDWYQKVTNAAGPQTVNQL